MREGEGKGQTIDMVPISELGQLGSKNGKRDERRDGMGITRER